MNNRKKIFIGLLFLIQLALIWPVYPVFSEIYPLVLGLPLSFAWVVGVLICAFLLMLWYHLGNSETPGEHRHG